MDTQKFIDALLSDAKAQGISPAEVYFMQGDSFSASCIKGEITNYSVNSTYGLSLRGIYHGKMGYASTEAFDDSSKSHLINCLKESAELIEDEAVEEIFAGSERYETINTDDRIDSADEKQKLDFVIDLEKRVLSIDARIKQITDAVIQTTAVTTVLKNTYGLSLTHKDNYAISYVGALAQEGDNTASQASLRIGFKLSELDAEKMAKECAENTLFMLDAKPVKSGIYRAIFEREAMSNILMVFSSVFSSENAQQGMSLLAGRTGETIAAPCVTLIDDPLNPAAFNSCPFDAEGVATYRKSIIENGVLKTLLYNLKTAKKEGVATTGNAARGSYAAAVHVAPSNLCLKAGDKDLNALISDMENGLVITDVEGLHASANPITGDFSLSAKGYTVKDGKKDAPVKQITVASNFYTLLKSIRAVGSDVLYYDSLVCPSVDVGEISVAGE